MSYARHRSASVHIAPWTVCAVLIILGSLLTACSLQRASIISVVQIMPPSEASNPDTVSFLPTGQLVVETNDNHFWRQVSPNGEWQEIAVKRNSLCKSTFYVQGRALPDGRLGMLCVGDVQHSSLFYTMVAYDLTLDTLEPLVPGLLPDNGAFSWKADMSQGVFSTFNSSYSTLYWITSATTQPITITLTEGSRSWYLPDSVHAREAYYQGRISYRDPQTVGKVGHVAWSPDGNFVAFWGTLDSIGRPSNALQRMPWDLYLLDTTTLDVRRIPLKVYDAFRLAWSPNSQWLAYIAPDEGVWLLDPQTNQPILIQEGIFHDLTWTPDGQRIVVIKCNESLCGTQGRSLPEIWIYDVSTLLT